MARKPRRLYDVVRQQDGALVRVGLPIADARSECADLNAQAKIVVGAVRFDTPNGPSVVTKYAGMFNGEVSRYEVKAQEVPLVIPSSPHVKMPSVGTPTAPAIPVKP